MAEDPVAATAAGEGVVAHAARPSRGPRVACGGGVAKRPDGGARRHACPRRPGGSQPGACPGGLAGLEMQTTVPGESGVAKDAGHGLGLYLARQGLLEGGVTFSMNAGWPRGGG